MDAGFGHSCFASPPQTTEQRERRPPPPIGRATHIDAVRALALLGVIIMNIASMIMMLIAREVLSEASPLDMTVAALDVALIIGKARSCFAFLFGAGFAIMMVRAEAGGRDFSCQYRRRMAALLLFGAINQVFLFWGDILVTYSLLGFALFAVRGWSKARMLKAGLLLILLPPLLHGAAEAVAGHPIAGFVADSASDRARALAAYTSDHYGAAVLQNVRSLAADYQVGTAHTLVYDLGVLGLFLLGAYAVRTGVVLDPGQHRPLLRRVAAWCIPVGFVASLGYVGGFLGLRGEGSLRAVQTASFVGVPILALGYLAVLGLWFSRGAARLQALLAPIGRMSLTNYLASSAFGCWFFYGYGLGRLRSLSISEATLFAIAVWLVLGVFSHLWLRRFPLGPVEWVWRRLTYGRPTSVQFPMQERLA